MRLGKATALFLLAMFAAPAALRAQSSMGTVSGTVTDSTGAVVPGATVTLTNESTNIQNERATDPAGFFTFVNVRPGPYTLTVELAGFNKAQVPTFMVGVSQSVGRNVTLQVGVATETVEVTAQNELLQTTTAELGNVVEEKVIRDLPLQGRNFTQLLLLTPGVNPVSTAQGPQVETAVNSIEGNSGIPGGMIANASVQGQQNRSKVYYMDGIINTSIRSGTYVALPDIDSLQEFKVQSQSDKAEFGGVTGGVINMTSKSGSNRFGGSAFGYFRNQNFSARNPFRDVVAGQAVEHPDYRQNVFGLNIGGPIFKNKTFFFASYDGWRYRDFSDTRITVPTEAMLNGDFSQAFHGRQIYNPFTTRIVNGRTVRDPFPGNIIPASMISPTMQAFLRAYMVRANISGNVAENFREAREQENNSNSFTVRLDHHFSTRDNVFLRWTERKINAFLPRGDVGYLEPDSSNRNFGGGWFHSFSPNMIFEARGGVATQPTEDAPLQHPSGLDPQRNLNLPQLDRFGGYIVSWQGLGANNTPYTNLPSIGVQGDRPRGNPNWNFATDLTWLKGRHNMKFGFQMLRISRLQRNQFGEIFFSPEATRDPQRTTTTGDPIASMLLGLPSQVRGFVPDQGYIDFHTSTLSGYVQDQWNLKPNLTITMGLRYDYVTRAIGHGDNLLQSGVDMNTGEWLLGVEEPLPVCTAGAAPPCLPTDLSRIPFNQYIRVTGERDNILKPIKDNFGPRFGLAWQMNPKTVLRTGYALMWDSMVSRSQYGQHQFESWGWPQFSGIDTGAINTESGAVTRIENLSSLPFLAPRAAPWNSTGFFNDPNRKNAYSHQWHVEVQRELSRNLMVGLAYVGSYNGRMEYAGRAQAPDRPAVDPATGRRFTAAERNAIRPWPHIDGTFTYSDDIGMSKYNALQLKLQRRFANGIGSMLSYTYSQTIDTNSGWFGAENGIGGGAAGVQNYHDIDSNRGRAGYDVPHIFTWATVWELPFGRNKRWLNDGGASWILGNWQLNWMVLARSGQPFTPSVGGDPANIGFTGYSRPNLVGDPWEGESTVDRFFNPAAFAVPVNSFGNVERNSLRGPGFWNVDFGLQKNISIGGNRELQVRVEAFNVFNHINWALTNAGVAIDNAATVGRITSMNGRPRQLQFGFRLVY
jgi:hypothetical protein